MTADDAEHQARTVLAVVSASVFETVQALPAQPLAVEQARARELGPQPGAGETLHGVRIEGKGYIMRDGDVVEFRFNA